MTIKMVSNACETPRDKPYFRDSDERFSLVNVRWTISTRLSFIRNMDFTEHGVVYKTLSDG